MRRDVAIPAVLVGQDQLDEVGPGSFEQVEKAGQVAEFGMDRGDVRTCRLFWTTPSVST